MPLNGIPPRFHRPGLAWTGFRDLVEGLAWRDASSRAEADTAVSVYEETITGLTAHNDSPTILGETTILSATVVAGTNVVYTWNLGDGTIITGGLVSHIYPLAGEFTAIVTASNTVSSETTTTMVQIEPLPPAWRIWMPLMWCED